MLDTLLFVELEAREHCVDLKTLSHIILNDLGATLGVLHCVGKEYGDAESRPVRMEDCLASIGMEVCLEAISTPLVLGDRGSKALAEISNHSREIAWNSKHLAEQAATIDPDEAYLVGLCHSIGSLPNILGWNRSKDNDLYSPWLGFDLAREKWLPSCVIDYCCDIQRCGSRSKWTELVQAAHRLARQHGGECIASEGRRPEPQRAI